MEGASEELGGEFGGHCRGCGCAMALGRDDEVEIIVRRSRWRI